MTRFTVLSRHQYSLRQIAELASMKVLFAIEDDLLKDPERGDIIPRTRVARKARVADRDSKRGKRGSYRYVYEGAIK